MDHVVISLQSVLVLLAAAVLAVMACRALRLPAMLGYLVTGLALGPYALGLAADGEETRVLAEFGVVFLMFSIGLEFSLSKLLAMRRLVFGLGGAQVAATMAMVEYSRFKMPAPVRCRRRRLFRSTARSPDLRPICARAFRRRRHLRR